MATTVSVEDLKSDPEWREIFDYARGRSKEISKEKRLDDNTYFFLLRDFFKNYNIFYDSDDYYKNEAITFVVGDPETVEKKIFLTWREVMEKTASKWQQACFEVSTVTQPWAELKELTRARSKTLEKRRKAMLFFPSLAAASV